MRTDINVIKQVFIDIIYIKLCSYFMRKRMKEDSLDMSKITKELCNYKNIPKDLSEYIINVIEETSNTKYFSPILNDDTLRKKAWETIDFQIKEGSKITKLPILALLKGLDFHSNNLGFSKFEGMFAELRTIFFLRDIGLDAIEPLESENKEKDKSADFIAKDLIGKGNYHKYAIEVFCKKSKELKDNNEINSNRKLSLKPVIKPDTARSDLIKLYKRGAYKKKPQLIQTAKKYSCDKNILVMVLNISKIYESLKHDDYIEILEDITVQLNWGSNYQFAIVTGMIDLFDNILDNYIYPLT